MKTQQKDHRRLMIVSIALLALFSLIVVKFFYIQIVDGVYWQKKAASQHYLIVEEPYKRGRLLAETTSRTHFSVKVPMVADLKQYHLFADPQAIPEHLKPDIARMLQPWLQDRSPQDALEDLNKPTRSRRLALGLSTDERHQLEAWWFAYAKQNKIPRNALYFTPDWCRCHPYGSLLGQVLHTIQTLKDEKDKQAIPTGGLEFALNTYLKGMPGKRRLMRTPRHSFESADLLEPPKDGKDVVLTIDPFLQAIAEEELEKGVRRSKAKGGWCVMMNPYNGEVLCLAQYPFFNPDHYAHYFSSPHLIEYTRLRASSDAHEMGSVMKPITLAIALAANEELAQQGKKNLFALDEKVATSDSKFPGRTKPLVDTHLHRFLNFYMAIQHSSNIYCARMIDRVLAAFGINWYREQLIGRFGFGQPTGIEYPGENPGVVPTPGKKHPNGKLEWSVATPYSLSMGHNIQVNSFQLVRAYSIFANGGYLVAPTLLKSIGGVPVPRQAPRKVLSESIIKEIVNGLRYVTMPGGSGYKGNIWGYTEGGKSSTAKKLVKGAYSEREYVSSFIGIAPIAKPAIVLLVTLDEPAYGYIPGYGKNHHGGNCAAQVFRQLGRRALEYLGVPEDDPGGYPVGDPRRDTAKFKWHRETQQLQEIYQKWNNH